LNGIIINRCDLPTVKSGLFKEKLQKFEFLYLVGNKIESIEPEAFQYLVNLKWIRLAENEIQTLPHRLFENNPELIYIDLKGNKINSIQPSFFEGLQKLKLINLQGNRCIDMKIGHGSVDAILSLTKMSTKSEAGDGCWVMSGAPNNSF
jgi:Leucine-rich repeat (LRR) protein